MVQTVDAEADRSGREDAPAPGEKLRLLDLFSGIGGFSLGLERSGGFETVAFCEIEPFPRRVLAKHWPGVPIYHDVRTITADLLAADGITIDAIAGGFPCQDISNAGNRVGIGGKRSGLWTEYARLVGELRPCVVIVENVADLLYRGLGVVLGDLAALGYDAEWHCIPAAAVGARHYRDRLWIVAHPHAQPPWDGEAERLGRFQFEAQIPEAFRRTRSLSEPEPAMGRMADDVPDAVDAISALGNAVVPQIPELIGRAITAALLADGAPTRPAETPATINGMNQDPISPSPTRKEGELYI